MKISEKANDNLARLYMFSILVLLKNDRINVDLAHFMFFRPGTQKKINEDKFKEISDIVLRGMEMEDILSFYGGDALHEEIIAIENEILKDLSLDNDELIIQMREKILNLIN